jgi:hypothetical protein
VFVTNLFGHPARLDDLRLWCDAHHTVLIEDNSQSSRRYAFSCTGAAMTRRYGAGRWAGTAPERIAA